MSSTPRYSQDTESFTQKRVKGTTRERPASAPSSSETSDVLRRGQSDKSAQKLATGAAPAPLTETKPAQPAATGTAQAAATGTAQPAATGTAQPAATGTAQPAASAQTPPATPPPPPSIKPAPRITPLERKGIELSPEQKFRMGVRSVITQQKAAKAAPEATPQGPPAARAPLAAAAANATGKETAAAGKASAPAPAPSAAAGKGDPNVAAATGAAMGMAYGGPLAGMFGPANAGALLQAQGQMKQLLDARTLPLTLMMPLLIALIAIILGFVISVYYVIMLIIMVIQQTAINAPLNIETVDYASIQSLTFFTPGQFNYTYFLLLPLVALGGIGIFTAIATVVEKPTPREIKGLVFIIGLAAVIMFFLQYLIYQKVGKTILAVEKRLKFFNTYVCTKIYKNSIFLKQLEIPQASIVGVHNTIKNCLQALAKATPEVDLAKAFFTLTMFYHYQKISLRNPIIFDAFTLFSTRSLLGRQCQPGAYLSRYGTYIEDISETLIRPQLSSEISSTTVDTAFILCNEWITNSNGYANTIYPEDSFSSFVIMAILTILIQLVPLYLIIKFYQEGQDAVSRILRSLMENLGVTPTKGEQQTI